MADFVLKLTREDEVAVQALTGIANAGEAAAELINRVRKAYRLDESRWPRYKPSGRVAKKLLAIDAAMDAAGPRGKRCKA